MNNTNRRVSSHASEARPKVAVVQAASVAFDLEHTLEKAETLAADAASQGARLVVFPEAFLSAYPRGLRLAPSLVHARTQGAKSTGGTGKAAWMSPAPQSPDSRAWRVTTGFIW